MPQHEWEEYAASRSPALKRHVVSSYVGLVKAIVHRFAGASASGASVMNHDDLFQVGMMGLLDAVERFDPTRGVKFETYAMTRIRGTVQDELRKLDWVPRSVREKVRLADRLVQQMECEKKRGIGAEQPVRKVAVSLEEYRRLVNTYGSIPEIVHTSFDSDEVFRNVSSQEEDDPLERLSGDEARTVLLKAVENLPERERLILALYYYEELTFREIAGIVGLSESRVIQKHAAVLGKMRQQMSELI